jgi:hypothetical protein
MNFGILLKKIDAYKKVLFRIYFTFGTLFIIILFSIYVYIFQKEASKEARIVPDLVNQFMFFSSHENFESIMTSYILHEIIANIEYPIIITNNHQVPQYWKNIGVDEIANWDNLPENIQNRIIKRLDRMRKKGKYIPLFHTEEEENVLSHTYYEDSTVIKRLKILPFVEIGLILFFTSFGTYALSHIRKSEKNVIWVGLAKETAHQFGTPITSLIGWIDLLKLRFDELPQKEEYVSLLDDMATDVEALKKVASRFGKVGSDIRLVASNVDNVIVSTLDYFQKRLPHINNEIRMHYIPRDPDTMLFLDVELVSWAFENIIKNCIDAMKRKSGNITIESYRHEQKFYLLISDEGVGIPKSNFNKVFEPGVTTKSRGWGLGLSLTKRIIEEYHSGKIRVLESAVDIGTTFEIVFPIPRQGE